MLNSREVQALIARITGRPFELSIQFTSRYGAENVSSRSNLS